MKKNIGLIILSCWLLFQVNYVDAHSCIIIDDSEMTDCFTVDILEANASEYKIRFKIHKIVDETISINGTIYEKLFLDRTISLTTIGEPALPILSQHIAIPPGCNYTAEIFEKEWKNVTVGNVYPAQKPITTLCMDNQFIINDSVYKCEQFVCPLMETTEIMNWKGIDNFFINICPFIYHPSSNSLSILSDFILSVKFYPDSRNSTFAPRFEENNIAIFDNRNCLRGFSNKLNNSDMNNDYLIIVGNIPEIENSQSMKTFRKWKALKGFNTKLVSTNTIGNDSASIKNYLAQQTGLKYVLFVGNNDKIPLVVLPAHHQQLGNYVLKSDYWYGCMDGNNENEAEFPIGRFLTNSLNDFANMVDKTIKYESLYHNWCSNNLLVSHSEIYNFQITLDSISNTNYSHPLSFFKAYGAPVNMGGLGSNKYDVINFINNGMNIVTVNCHGNAGGFWMYDGDNSTISYEDRTLLSSDTYPVFFSNACNNGDFANYNHSIAAYFSCSDHCSSAYSGTTMPSYIFPGNQFLHYLYSNLLNNNIFNLGDLILNSHIMNLGYGNIAIDNAFNYICGGDPSLEIWTGSQEQFENVEITVIGNNLKISVDNASYFTANVVSDDGTLLEQHTSGATSNLLIPMPIENCDIAIVKHNYIPYIIHINVEDLYIQNVSFVGNNYYVGSPINVGYNVNNSQSSGNVVVESGARLMINKGSGVKILNGFECCQGGELIVK